MSDLTASLVRTLVPWVVATVGPWAARWLGLTDEQLSAGATVAAGAVYYLLSRCLETWGGERFGWLLGVPARPAYPTVR